MGLGSFSRSRVGPRVDVRLTSRQKVTLIIAAAVCGASPFISTRHHETLQGDYTSGHCSALIAVPARNMNYYYKCPDQSGAA